jgi:hypothetical protein
LRPPKSTPVRWARSGYLAGSLPPQLTKGSFHTAGDSPLLEIADQNYVGAFVTPR